MHISFLKKKKNWPLICGDGIAEIGGQKKLLQLVYGNGFAEIVEKKLFDFWQWHCRNNSEIIRH